MDGTPVHDFYFDRHQRFKATADLLAKALGETEGLDILDVGNLDNALSLFLPGCAVTPYEELVLPGRPITHGDKAYDVAVALDVLEHVEREHRPFLLAELNRISRRGFVLGFPTAQAAQAEAFVLELTDSPWLAEHQKHGLPRHEEVEEELSRQGLTFQREPNASLPSWTAMMLLMHGVEDPMRHTISAFFNEHFYAVENREPAYRYIYFCTSAAQGNH